MSRYELYLPGPRQWPRLWWGWTYYLGWWWLWFVVGHLIRECREIRREQAALWQ